VNGCAWTQQPFTVVVANPPVLAPTPSKIILTWAEGGRPPVAVINVASSWPNQTYSVRVQGDWLAASAHRGRTVSATGDVFEDQVELRVRLNERADGRYLALVEFTAWQMQPLTVPVEMLTEKAEPKPVETPRPVSDARTSGTHPEIPEER
jgi:hypothetical protein